MGDPYVDPRTGVLRNRLGISDEDELRAAEADISAAELFALELSSHLGEGHFDFSHLRALHAHIFGEIYAWAGKPRTVDIAKGTWFCLARNIEEFAASVFRGLAAENFLVGLDRADLVSRVAALYGQLNALHPFREGNGRTQRAFLTRLGRLGGWRIRWSDMDPDINVEASRRSLEAGDDSALATMIDRLLDEVPPRPELAGARRRVVLALPAVAEEIPGGIEQFRAGPYPAEATCSVCGDRYPPVDEPSVVLLRPLPPPEATGIFTYAHLRCSRSRILRAASAREVRAWRAAREQEGADATGAAILLMTSPPRAAFAWRINEALLAKAGDDAVDVFLSKALELGMRPAATLIPPDEPTPGWSVRVQTRTSSVTVTDPEGVRAFFAHQMELPDGWLEAVRGSGDCVLYMVSRGEVDPQGLRLAAQQGRALSGVASAAIDPA